MAKSRVSYGRSGYVWDLSEEDRRIVALSFLFLAQEMPPSLLADYVGMTPAAAQALGERIDGQDGSIILSAQDEAAARAHLRLLPERMSDRSFRDFVMVSKAAMRALEGVLDLGGYRAVRAEARRKALAAGAFQSEVARAVAAYGSGKFGETMGGLQLTAANRCHAIDFGLVAEEVVHQEIGDVLLGIVESRPSRAGSTRDWLLDIASAGVIDLGFVIAERYAPESARARSLLAYFESETSRAGVARACRSILDGIVRASAQ
jgi:hypothetical protein